MIHQKQASALQKTQPQISQSSTMPHTGQAAAGAEAAAQYDGIVASLQPFELDPWISFNEAMGQ